MIFTSGLIFAHAAEVTAGDESFSSRKLAESKPDTQMYMHGSLAWGLPKLCRVPQGLRRKGWHSMRQFLGLTVLIFGLSVPAHAQAAKGGMTMGGSTGGVMTNGGGGYGGGYGGGDASGGVGGGMSFRTLPHAAPAALRSSAVMGSDSTFEPSTFLPYDRAIAAGQAVLDGEHESVAEAAAENSRAPKLKARASIIENAAGNPIITTP